MRRTQLMAIIGTVLIFTLVLIGASFAQGVTVQVADNPTVGKILTDANGMTLYIFAVDEENVSKCYDGCAQNWPPLTVAADETPTAGADVPGELGVIDRTDGTRQVTYNGMPLYYFFNDAQPGDANGQNLKDVWFVAHPATTDMTVASPVVNVSTSALGDILTSQGMTLYMFTKDMPGVSNCNEGCMENWPPLLVNGGEAVAGTGLSGELSIITRADGGQQVAYNGQPLYFWKNDRRIGDTTGQGVKDVWFVVNPAEAMAMTAPAELPVTGGNTFPLTTILLIAAGAVLLVGGVATSRMWSAR